MHELFGLTLFEPCFKAIGKIRRGLYGREISEEEKRPADFRILLRAALALCEMSLHANELDTSEGVVYECKVLITKIAAIH
jgi:hypothetical protein